MSWRSAKSPLLFNEDYTAKPSFYSIVDGLDVPETSETTEPPTEDTPGTLTPAWGDVNEDDEIDIRDVILLNKSIFGKETLSDQAKANADTDENGIVDATDSLTVMKLIVKLLSVSDLPIKNE